MREAAYRIDGDSGDRAPDRLALDEPFDDLMTIAAASDPDVDERRFDRTDHGILCGYLAYLSAERIPNTTCRTSRRKRWRFAAGSVKSRWIGSTRQCSTLTSKKLGINRSPRGPFATGASRAMRFFVSCTRARIRCPSRPWCRRRHPSRRPRRIAAALPTIVAPLASRSSPASTSITSASCGAPT